MLVGLLHSMFMAYMFYLISSQISVPSILAELDNGFNPPVPISGSSPDVFPMPTVRSTEYLELAIFCVWIRIVVRKISDPLLTIIDSDMSKRMSTIRRCNDGDVTSLRLVVLC